MRLIIDIPEQWRDDMVWEKFDKQEWSSHRKGRIRND